jgi:hypothetical protein
VNRAAIAADLWTRQLQVPPAPRDTRSRVELDSLAHDWFFQGQLRQALADAQREAFFAMTQGPRCLRASAGGRYAGVRHCSAAEPIRH